MTDFDITPAAFIRSTRKARVDVLAILLSDAIGGLGWLIDLPQRTNSRIYTAPVKALSILPFYPMRLFGFVLVVLLVGAAISIRMSQPQWVARVFAGLLAFWMTWTSFTIYAFFTVHVSWQATSWAVLVLFFHFRLFAAIPILISHRR